MTDREQGRNALTPLQGHGVGLRPVHYDDVLSGRFQADFFEIIVENYLSDGGWDLRVLERVREFGPVAFHGVSMSLGSTDPLDRSYLTRLRELIRRFDPAIVSDHCCWTRVGGKYLHDLLPLPFTEEALEHLAGRIREAQDFLGRRLLIENVSSYLSFTHSELTEWEFLSELCRRADCGLLLDINNIYVNSVNHAIDPLAFLDGLPAERVTQFHLAGHEETPDRPNGGRFLIDTHGAPVCEEVWELYGQAVRRYGRVPALLERDNNIPGYVELLAELDRARNIEETVRNESTHHHSTSPARASAPHGQRDHGGRARA